MRILLYHRHKDHHFFTAVAEGFPQAGHTIEIVNADSGMSGIDHEIGSFNPDFIFSISTAPELSKHLASGNTPIVHYELDKVTRSDFFKPGIFNQNDIVLCTYRDNVDSFKKTGAGCATYLPFFPNAKPAETARDKIDFKYDVTFVGSLQYDNDYRWYLDEYGKVAAANPEAKKIFDGLICKAMEALLNEQQRYLDENRYILPEIVTQVIKPETRELFELFRLNEGRLLSLCAKEAANRQRRYYIEHVKGINIFGPDKELAKSNEINYHGSVDLYEGSSQVFCESKINLAIQRIYAQDGLSDRIFNILRAGGFLLSDRNKAVTDLFEEGKEIACFSSREELLEKIDYYLKHEEEREQIARNGYERVMSNHTLEKRIQTIAWIVNSHRNL